MAHKLGDRVREMSSTVGTGSIALGGAVTGHQTFDAILDTGDTTFYAIVQGDQWETGLGTFTAPSTLARTTVLESSSAGAKINFSTGTKDVFVTVPGSRVPLPATGAETVIGTDDLKFVSPAALTGARASAAQIRSRAEGRILTADNLDVIREGAATFGLYGIPLAGGGRAAIGPFGGGSAASTAITANRLYLVATWAPRPITLSSLMINVLTAASGNCRLGVYGETDGGLLGPLLLDAGVVATGTTGIKSLGTSLALSRGRYYLALLASAGPSISTTPAASAQPASGWSTSGFTPIAGVGVATQAYGPLPASPAIDAFLGGLTTPIILGGVA